MNPPTRPSTRLAALTLVTGLLALATPASACGSSALANWPSTHTFAMITIGGPVLLAFFGLYVVGGLVAPLSTAPGRTRRNVPSIVANRFLSTALLAVGTGVMVVDALIFTPLFSQFHVWLITGAAVAILALDGGYGIGQIIRGLPREQVARRFQGQLVVLLVVVAPLVAMAWANVHTPWLPALFTVGMGLAMKGLATLKILP